MPTERSGVDIRLQRGLLTICIFASESNGIRIYVDLDQVVCLKPIADPDLAQADQILVVDGNN